MSRIFTFCSLCVVLLFSSAGCAATSTEEITRPSQLNPSAISSGEATPESSLFYSLPLHKAKDSVLAGGYGIRLEGITFDEMVGNLRLDLTITNTTESQVDLVWAVQLRDGNGGLVQPQRERRSDETVEGETTIGEMVNLVQAESSFRGTWIYPVVKTIDSQSAFSIDTYKDYRLVFAPKGWSGPVIIYSLMP